MGDRQPPFDTGLFATVKLVFPFTDIMEAFPKIASDEDLLRDADMAALAVATLATTGNVGLSLAVARLIAYVCRTMGPQNVEDYTTAMYDLFELMGTCPTVPIAEKNQLIRQMDGAARCILTAVRTTQNISLAQTFKKFFDDNPEHRKEVMTYLVASRELSLFSDNPLTKASGKKQ